MWIEALALLAIALTLLFLLLLRAGANKKHSLGEKICAAALITSILTLLFFSPSIFRLTHEHDFAHSNCTTLKCRDCDATTPMETPCHIFIRVDCETAKCSTCGVIAEDISIHEPKCSPYTCEICNRYISETQEHRIFCSPYTCDLCGVRISETNQFYHDYASFSADSCTTTEKCRICSATYTHTLHYFDYSNADSCAATRECTVCQKDIPIAYPNHRWTRTECGQSLRCDNCGQRSQNISQHVYQTRLFGSYTYCIYCDHCDTFNPENLNWFSVIYFACGLAVFIATMLLALKHRDRCSKVNWTATNLFLNDPSPDAITVTTRHFSVAVTLAHTLSALKEDSEIPED